MTGHRGLRELGITTVLQRVWVSTAAVPTLLAERNAWDVLYTTRSSSSKSLLLLLPPPPTTATRYYRYFRLPILDFSLQAVARSLLRQSSSPVFSPVALAGYFIDADPKWSGSFRLKPHRLSPSFFISTSSGSLARLTN